MKNSKKTLLLSSSLLLLLTSCGSEAKTIYETSTQSKVISHGNSEYTILLPSSPNSNLLFAASELQTFLKEATDASLPIVQEEEGKNYSGQKTIQLGWTKEAKAKAAFGLENNYGDSGYSVYPKDDDIFIFSTESGTQEGVIYGVYDLLSTWVDFKAYANDEIEYSHKDYVYLPQQEKTYVPTFDHRELDYLELSSDKEGASRLHLTNHANTGSYAAWCHTLTNRYCKILPDTEYLHDHPDWYSDQGLTAHDQIQLCYTARGNEESYKTMVHTMAENVYQNYILKYPDAKYIMLGQADNYSWCKCDACQELYKACDSKLSAIQVAFANDLIDEIDKVMEENQDTKNKERDLRYSIFAYQDTVIPYETNKINNPKVHWRDNLYVMFTPIEVDYLYDLHSGGNSPFYDYLQSWKNLSDGKVTVYTYDVNFSHFLCNFPNWGSFKSHVEDFVDAGITDFYSQGPVINNVAGLTRMRFYVESQILWNKSQDYDTLAYDFMDHYYKDAAPYLKKYYEVTRDRYYAYAAESGQIVGNIYAQIETGALWDQSTLFELYDLLNQAFTAIEPWKEKDPAMFEKLTWRIKHELVTVYYLLLSNYPSSFSAQAQSLMKEEFHKICDHFEITKALEGGNGFPF